MIVNKDIDNTSIPLTKEVIQKKRNIRKKPNISEKPILPQSRVMKETSVAPKRIEPSSIPLVVKKPTPLVIPTVLQPKEEKKVDMNFSKIVNKLRDITREQTTLIIKQSEDYEFNRTNLLPIVHTFKEMLKHNHKVMKETNQILSEIIDEITTKRETND